MDLLFHCVDPGALVRPTDKTAEWWRGRVFSLRSSSCCSGCVLPLPSAMCSGLEERLRTRALLFGSGEQLKWSHRTMGGHYSLIDRLWKLMKRAGDSWILEHWVHIRYWMLSGIDAIRRNLKTWQLALKLFQTAWWSVINSTKVKNNPDVDFFFHSKIMSRQLY